MNPISFFADYLKKDIKDDLTEVKAFQNVLFYLHNKLNEEKLRKITEGFIAELGQKHLFLKIASSDMGDLTAQFGGEF